jgi:hypothetical protein
LLKASSVCDAADLVDRADLGRVDRCGLLEVLEGAVEVPLLPVDRAEARVRGRVRGVDRGRLQVLAQARARGPGARPAADGAADGDEQDDEHERREHEPRGDERDDRYGGAEHGGRDAAGVARARGALEAERDESDEEDRREEEPDADAAGAVGVDENGGRERPDDQRRRPHREQRGERVHVVLPEGLDGARQGLEGAEEQQADGNVDGGEDRDVGDDGRQELVDVGQEDREAAAVVPVHADDGEQVVEEPGDEPLVREGRGGGHGYGEADLRTGPELDQGGPGVVEELRDEGEIAQCPRTPNSLSGQ